MKLINQKIKDDQIQTHGMCDMHPQPVQHSAKQSECARDREPDIHIPMAPKIESVNKKKNHSLH